jgi:hypothetical protein
VSRALVRSGRGRLHVATDAPGLGWVGVCGSFVVRPKSIEALTPAAAAQVVDAAPGVVCHYCRLIAIEVQRALEIIELEAAL